MIEVIQAKGTLHQIKSKKSIGENKQDQITQNKIIQRYVAGYVPNLEGLTVPGGGLERCSRASFQRPSGWYEGTLDQLVAACIRAGRVQISPVMGMDVVMIMCEGVERPSNVTDVDIGHIINWEEYVDSKQPQNVREATNAYNDLNNLRLECPAANRSHDFEKDTDGYYKLEEEEVEIEEEEGKNINEYDLSDPFIDDSRSESYQLVAVGLTLPDKDGSGATRTLKGNAIIEVPQTYVQEQYVFIHIIECESKDDRDLEGLDFIVTSKHLEKVCSSRDLPA